jgi:fructan beta-fructosidase
MQPVPIYYDGGKEKMRHFILTLTVVFASLLSHTVPAAEQPDILIADFEAADYGDWKVEGEAFGTAPAKGTLPGQMHVSGFEGERLVNSFLGGDKSTGKLTSPEFTIQRDYLKFLIGGGGHPGKTCMNLLIDGEVVLSRPVRIYNPAVASS